MSADNGVYILETSTIWDRITPHHFQRRDSKKSIYRVAHTQGIDNLDWYMEHERENVGAYLVDVFGKSEVYDTLHEATKVAHDMAKKVLDDSGILEYGVSHLSHPELTFYGD